MPLATATAPVPAPGLIAVTVTAAVGDYRAGDMLWCDRLSPERFGQALNRDALVPRAAGRYAFGRLLDRDGRRLHLLPPGPGARQVVTEAPWLAVAVTLVRGL